MCYRSGYDQGMPDFILAYILDSFSYCNRFDQRHLTLLRSCRAENTNECFMRRCDNVIVRNKHREIFCVRVLRDYRTVL